LWAKNEIMQKLKDKVALITGGTSGMGLATAKAFIREGARVIITGRYDNTVAGTVRQLGGQASGIVSDAGNMEDLFRLQEQVKEQASGLDILYVNAGYGKFAPIESVTVQDMDELFNVIVKGTFFTVQQLLPLMGAGGSVILNTSVVTEYGSQNFSVYSAAKAAVKSFVKTFSAECLSRRIRVNGISPGYILTNGFKKTGLSEEQINTAIAAIMPTLPYGRFGLPDEIANAVTFLASEEASYIHGTEIVVDGGYVNLR
jgi:NAD(P)-dependent dehydrogenase (short-subunit alcohol dehydrogenase family)